MLDSVFVDVWKHSIHRHNVFGVVVVDEFQVSELPVYCVFRGKEICDLDVCGVVVFAYHKVNLGLLKLSDIDLVS